MYKTPGHRMMLASFSSRSWKWCELPHFILEVEFLYKKSHNNKCAETFFLNTGLSGMQRSRGSNGDNFIAFQVLEVVCLVGAFSTHNRTHITFKTLQYQMTFILFHFGSWKRCILTHFTFYHRFLCCNPYINNLRLFLLMIRPSRHATLQSIDRYLCHSVSGYGGSIFRSILPYVNDFPITTFIAILVT